MVDQLSCDHCDQVFQDGSIVSVYDGSDRLYHHILREPGQHANDCSFQNVMSGGSGGSFNNGVYYQGSIYSFEAIDAIAKTEQISIGLNDDENGTILRGNLEGLARRRPIFPKRTIAQSVLGLFSKTTTNVSQ